MHIMSVHANDTRTRCTQANYSRRGLCSMNATTFALKAEVIDHLRQQYLQQGVVLSINRSNEWHVVLKCDRGGSYRNKLHLTDVTRQRKTSSRLAGCPFEIVCSVQKGMWAVRKLVGSHNHPVGGDLAGHSVLRHPTLEETARIKELGCLGVAPKQILAVLHKEFPSNKSTAQEVYNVMQSAKAECLRGRTPIEALADLVSEGGYVSKVWLEEQHVNGIFFMHEDSVKLAKVYGTVFLLDCTYQTNKFSMPLLNIVGITCTYATFNAGFAFMRAETEAFYTWALRQLAAVVQPTVLCTDRDLALMKSIASVFPACHNLLCIWHINKNVAVNCKKHFLNGEEWNRFLAAWNGLVYSKSDVQFEEAFAAFTQAYSVSHPDAFAYVNGTWIPHKAKFVAGYINDWMHFGTSSTSRVEGNHHVIKSYLRLGSLDLLLVLNRLTIMLANQMVELNTEMCRQQVVVPHHLNQDIFRDLHFKVSLFAMDKVHAQLHQLKKDYTAHHAVENSRALGVFPASMPSAATWNAGHVYLWMISIHNGTSIATQLTALHPEQMMKRDRLLASGCCRTLSSFFIATILGLAA